MEQHAVVAGRHAEPRGHVGGVHPFDVVQHEHSALTCGKLRQAVMHATRQPSGCDALVDVVGPRGERSRPRVVGIEHLVELVVVREVSAPRLVRAGARARLTRMWKIHVLIDDRPSKWLMPRTTPSQVS